MTREGACEHLLGIYGYSGGAHSAMEKTIQAGLCSATLTLGYCRRLWSACRKANVIISKGDKMKKILTILFAALIGMTFVTSTASADVGKGQKIILKKLKKACIKAGIENGGVLAKKHTQAEWKALEDPEKLNEELAKLCPGVKKLKAKYAKHTFDFLYNYASDSGNVPS